MPYWQGKRRLIAAGLLVIALAYPLIAYGLLSRLPPGALALALVALLMLRLAIATDAASTPARWAAGGAALGVAALALFDGLVAIKAYPVLISLGLAAVFAYTLAYPPSAIERIARLSAGVLDARAIAYTRNVTVVWLVFFLVNAGISLWTSAQSLEIWTLYNGLISYLVVATLFMAEYAIRIRLRRPAGSTR